jgi:hypothetical protein
LDQEAVSKLQYESREDKGDLNFWWHSHVNMSAFWSGTDMATIKEFGSKGYLLATVFNKKGDYQTAYYQGSTGFLPALFLDKLDTSFSHLPTSSQLEAWESEYKEKATEKKWSPSTWTSGGKAIGGQEGSKEAQSTGYRRDYGWGYGYDEDDYYDRLPSKYHNPSSYSEPLQSAKGIGEKNASAPTGLVMGVSSGLSHTQLGFALRRMYREGTKNSKFEDLSIPDQLAIMDVFDMTNGYDGTEVDYEELYERVIGSHTTMNDVVYEFMDAVALMKANQSVNTEDEDEWVDEDMDSNTQLALEIAVDLAKGKL